MTFVAGVVSTDETWAGLQDQVENATRKSELRRVEDQVDAVLCAYLAHFVEHRPDLVTRYGDPETGYIVTPTLGAEVVPPQADLVRDAVREYAAQHAELTRAGQQAVALVQGLLDEAGINYLSVSGRTKSVPSFAEKAARTKAGTPLYTDPATQITDLLGVRVITYVRDDVDAVADVLAEQVLVHDDRDWGLQTANEGRFGYASRHLMIGLDPAREDHPDFAHLRGHRGPGAGADGAAARVGRVRARHPLQGHGAGRARRRVRPPLHPRRRAPRARRPRVLRDPRTAPRRRARGQRGAERRRPAVRHP